MINPVNYILRAGWSIRYR